MLRLALGTTLLAVLPLVRTSPVVSRQSTCHYLPTDSAWPSAAQWSELNQTVGGRLIRGVPLGQPCYPPQLDQAKCTQVQDEWTLLPPFIADPVNVMSPYWMNDSCNPFFGPGGSCTLGNLAQYAINVSGSGDVLAGIHFAQNNNIRLTIKNSGHDFLGRSTGKGSLALWTHNLNQINFTTYSSSLYTGPAVKIGVGAEYEDVYPAAKAKGYRVVGGSCSTVTVVGGFSQAAGHGPLGSLYGLGSDQVLEWEVVTATGQVMTASPTQNADLYRALAGGGPGNYAVVLSATVRAYPDGPVAGAGFTVANIGDSTAYWAAITAWLQYLLVIDAIEGMTTVFTITGGALELVFATLPDTNSTANIDAALSPFLNGLKTVNVSISSSYESNVHPDYASHYAYWAPRQEYDSNITLGGGLIPRTVVQDDLPALVSVFKDITAGGALILSVGLNVIKGNLTANSVLPAWRTSLFTTTFARSLPVTSTWDTIRSDQAQLNAWQNELRTVTQGGAYMNEATWDNPNWKDDYFGSNYNTLLTIKQKYDPKHVFWANAAVGSDQCSVSAADGRLCCP
ncbi:FAD/FMN-containing isoamyl alcohol oxidase-like protein MreA [Nemania sp. FL0916]|nr:FAD/FMN-containing isoamyl alcohol oxidase-like protein MreA [Nemania sp. FL0916]